jgi:hypothetical protein
VEVLLEAARKLGLDTLIASKRCRQRDLIMAMIVERLIHPRSKLASLRHWNDTTLAEELSVADAEVDELYAALDWLLARQETDREEAGGTALSEGVSVSTMSQRYYTESACSLALMVTIGTVEGAAIIVYGVLKQTGRAVRSRSRCIPARRRSDHGARSGESSASALGSRTWMLVGDAECSPQRRSMHYGCVRAWGGSPRCGVAPFGN